VEQENTAAPSKLVRTAVPRTSQKGLGAMSAEWASPADSFTGDSRTGGAAVHAMASKGAAISSL